MSSGIKASLFFLLMLTGIGGAAAQSPSNHRRASGMEADVPKIKEAMLGNWESIAPEVRPSAGKNADGSLKPFYLKRAFMYLPSDRFELEIVNSADPYGAVPLARIKIGGHMLWQGPPPLAPRAPKSGFLAPWSDEGTPPSTVGKTRRCYGGHGRSRLRDDPGPGRGRFGGHSDRPRRSQGTVGYREDQPRSDRRQGEPRTSRSGQSRIDRRLRSAHARPAI